MKNNLELCIWVLTSLSLGFYGTEFQTPLLVAGGILLFIRTVLGFLTKGNF
jgi:hypothetical protein